MIYNKNYHKKIPKEAVLVDRTTKWGNLFKIGDNYGGKILTRQNVITQHKDWLFYSDQGQELLKSIEELIDKDLICWCWPQLCHGTNLELAAILEKEKKLWGMIEAGVL